MKKRWVIKAKKADFYGLSDSLGIDPVAVRVMVNRGIDTGDAMRSFLSDEDGETYDPHLLLDGEKAASIIAAKIKDRKKIRVFGDYDADGVMSSFVLKKALERVGADVDVDIPHRIDDGYGLSDALVRKAYADGVDTILTCDNGISAAEQIELAHALGMTVVVTDHHDVPFSEEDGVRRELTCGAEAVVNPKQEKCRYPYKKLCGCAVAWKFAKLLYETFGINPAEADCFIWAVGFATVTDVMDLDGENRTLVKRAFRAVRDVPNIGMRALIAAAGVDKEKIGVSEIGFRLGPCINASGRMGSAKTALSLLLSETGEQAEYIANQLVSYNNERKAMTEAAKREAVRIIEERGYDKNCKVLVVFMPDCHESLAGIVAGRLRERYARPAFVLTRGKDGAKGSGRSVDAYDMYRHLTKEADLLLKFGGHPKAAGLSIREEDIDALRDRLNADADVSWDELVEKIVIDSEMPIGYSGEKLIADLEKIGPYGTGNPKPLFAARDLRIEKIRRFGTDGNFLELSFVDARGSRVKGTYFFGADRFFEAVSEKYSEDVARGMLAGRCDQNAKMNIAYYPELDTYFYPPRVKLRIEEFC